MSSFTYRVSRLDGTTLEGQAQGHDEAAIRSSLEGQGYLVLELARKDGQRAGFPLSSGRRKIRVRSF